MAPFCGVALCILWCVSGCNKSSSIHSSDVAKAAEEPVYHPRPTNSITFTKEIAPIVFQNCSGCHRLGQSGPFPLLTAADVQKHARQIAEVTQSRYMPPWLPNSKLVHFAGERRLSVEQIGLIQQWAAEGAREGAAGDLPALPKWNDEWQLGKPDLVATAARPYILPAEGKDVYRNMIVAVPLSAGKF